MVTTGQNHAQRMTEAGLSVTRGANLYWAPPESFEIVAEPGHHCFDPAFDPKAISPAMVQSIDEQGVQTPVEVQVDGTSLLVVFGRGRVTHCRVANEARQKRGEEPRKVPYVIFKGTEQDARDRIVFENFHRKVPKPSDYAARIAEYRKGGLSEERMSVLLNVPARMLPQYEALSDCAAAVRNAVDDKTLPMAAVATLRALSKEDQVARLGEFKAAVGAGSSKQAALTTQVKKKAPADYAYKITLRCTGEQWSASHVVRGGKGKTAKGGTITVCMSELAGLLLEAHQKKLAAKAKKEEKKAKAAAKKQAEADKKAAEKLQAAAS